MSETGITPEVIERLRQSGIRIDREGTFWHEGNPVTHEGLKAALFRWLDVLPDGRTVLRLDDARYANVDVADCDALAESLRILGARRMIVAHTVHERITPRCGDRVWAIDVGMSRAYGGRVQVLEITNDSVLRVITPEPARTGSSKSPPGSADRAQSQATP